MGFRAGGGASVMRRVAELWNGYLFGPGDARDLAVARILACAVFFESFFRRDYAAWGTPPDFFWQPIAAFRMLGLSQASPEVLAVLGVVWKTSLLLGLVGLFTRVSLGVACVLGFYLVGLPHNFGKIDHGDTIVPLVLIVLACSRCGDALSIDRWWATRRTGTTEPPAPSGSYRWPVRCVWLLAGLVFSAAGIAKLRNGGLAWITSDSMRFILLKHHYAGYTPWTKIGLSIAATPWLYKPMAAAAVIAETGAILGCVSRIARCTLIPALLAMIIAFKFTMGFTPRPHYALFAFYVPWGAVIDAVRRPRREAESAFRFV